MTATLRENCSGTISSGLYTANGFGYPHHGVMFTAQGNYNLTSIKVFLAKYYEAIDATYELSLWTVSGGLPNTKIVGKTFSTTILGAYPSYTEIEVTLDTPYAMVADTDYALVLGTDSENNDAIVVWAYIAETTDYQVSMWYSAYGWQTPQNYGVTFKLYGEDSAYTGDITGWWTTVGGKLAPRWRDPLTDELVTGVCGLDESGKIYPICDDNIGGHTAPINGVVTSEMRPKITV